MPQKQRTPSNSSLIDHKAILQLCRIIRLYVAINILVPVSHTRTHLYVAINILVPVSHTRTHTSFYQVARKRNNAPHN